MTGVQTCGLFFASRRRHTRFKCDWSSDVCSSDLRPPDVDSYPAPTPQACVMLTHTTLHTALLFCILHFTLYFPFLYIFYIFLSYILVFSCVVLIVFLCFMFTGCTYTPKKIPGRCKPINTILILMSLCPRKLLYPHWLFIEV